MFVMGVGICTCADGERVIFPGRRRSGGKATREVEKLGFLVVVQGLSLLCSVIGQRLLVAMASPGNMGAGAMSMRGGGGARRLKWALELSLGNTRGRGDRQSNQGDALYPIGYSDKPVPDTSVQETDRNLVNPSLSRCWDVALGPLKQIPMNLFIMYMSGNTISIFPIMMVCMMAWRPIQALMSMSATFKLLESSSQQWLQGLVYLIGNLLGLALAVYKCQSMGLLPTHSSDWLAFIEPPQRMEIMGGGMVL
ncbi:ER membrane protein complex subunit 4 [Lepisosteus oculatus]|uniref:ER membrane protein complex subunit 4 n=1 Tax=Lepisosteus oculatus TaxID=7918 RepID=UPI003724A075